MFACRLSGICLIILVFSLTVAACAGSSAESTQVGPPTESSTTEVPDTPVGEQLRWALAVISGEDLEVEAIEERFAPQFLEQVPAESIREMLVELAADSGPFELIEVAAPADSSDESSVALRAFVVDREETPFLITLGTTDEAPHQIQRFSIRSAPWRDQGLPQSWSELDEAMRAYAPMISVVAAEIVDGELSPRFEIEPDRSLAVGSAFKLYVLGALATAVYEGRLNWDDPLVVNPAWRSMGGGVLREVEDGSSLTLREYADPMIAVSDNTATDHLIHHIGRENVEAIQSEMGHRQPELNRPFLTTRDMFMIKLVLPPARRQDYVDGDEAERRQIVAETADLDIGTALWATMLWTGPRLIEEVEWFASANDLCRAMISLKAMSETSSGDPVGEILSQNPGIGFDPQRWVYVAYKGGSEPGVLNFTWMLRRDDERWFCLSMSFNDTEQLVDTDEALPLAAAAANLLGQ